MRRWQCAEAWCEATWEGRPEDGYPHPPQAVDADDDYPYAERASHGLGECDRCHCETAGGLFKVVRNADDAEGDVLHWEYCGPCARILLGVYSIA